MELETFLERAGRVVPGIELNSVLQEIRDASAGTAVSYEMVLDGRTMQQLLEVELPKLTEHLLAKRLPMLGAPHLVITCWHHQQAHLFAGDEFFEAIASALGISLDELRQRISGWRERAGFHADPWSRPNAQPK